MSKLTINLADKQIVAEPKTVWLFTLKYNWKIKKNEAHAEPAAKLIWETEDQLSRLIIINPIIISDEDNNIKVFTDSSFEEASKFEKPNKKEIRLLKKKRRMYTSESKLGSSVEESLDGIVNEGLYEAKILSQRVEKLERGGGF